MTDLADQAVILPLVAAIAVSLVLQGWPRGAMAWLLIVSVTFATTLGLKLIFLACTPVFGALNVHSPSGHVAAATIVVGGLAAMVCRRRRTILPIALVAAAIIGISRLILGVHSLPEVVLGAVVGLIGVVALVRAAGPAPPLRLVPIGAATIAVLVVFHGLRLPAEAAIRHTALHFADAVEVCRPAPTRAVQTLP